MVNDQAIVIYSCLRLVVLDVSKVRWVLWMFITNGSILYVPMTVLFFGPNTGDTRFACPAAIYN